MEAISLRKEREEPESVSPLEFNCLSPLKLYEHCVSCPQFGEDCPHVKTLLALLSGEKKLRYSWGLA